MEIAPICYIILYHVMRNRILGSGGIYLTEFVWRKFISHAQCIRGPYFRNEKRGETYKFYQRASELCPHGPPFFNHPWVVRSRETVKSTKLLNGRPIKNNLL